MTTAVFRVDAGPGIGGGHVMRCLALSNRLAGHGWHCTFASRRGTMETVPALAGSDHELWTLAGPTNDEHQTLAAGRPDGADWLIVDHYGRDATFESALRKWSRNILVIDDSPNRAHDCDLLVDQTLGRDVADYISIVPEGAAVLAGARYALLAPQFAAKREAALARRDGPVGRILVSVGAGNPGNITATILEAIRRSELHCSVDVVMGSTATGVDTIERGAAALSPPATIHVDTRRMADLMVGADLAVGASGTTSWERCCLGLPTILVVTAENQRDIAAALENAGAALSLGNIDGIEAEFLAGRIRALADDDAARAGMARAAAAVCDGLGAERVVERMTAPTGATLLSRARGKQTTSHASAIDQVTDLRPCVRGDQS